ncbi:ATP-grasp domain-containing protein [Streptomyces sp. NPDC097610]|uniref:ATP-grasp domain-containing protein n=1 Tax=Streptomyces sp. NPDC097610 TaxID=3157227 RepID=UPI0033298145
MTIRRTSPGPILLVGAGGNAFAYREFSLSRLSAHTVVLADDSPPDWTRPYLTRHLSVDLTDSEGTAATVKKFAAEHHLAGVVAYMEHHVVLAAELARVLDLPGSSPQSMAATRDKAMSRRLLAQHGVPSARSLQAADTEEAVAHAERLGYPVVVKPRSMAGSAGVVRADTADEVRSAFGRASVETVLSLDQYGVHGVLVEEYLDGPEISAETVVLAPGDTRIVAVTRKRLGPEPVFQEYGHTVDASDELLHDPVLAAVVAAAVEALDITVGVLHVELRLTSSGPRIVEVNGQVGGDLIPLLVHAATGIDLLRVAAALATGAAPDLQPRRQRAAAIRFAYPAVTGTVDHLSMPGAVINRAVAERFVWTRQIGDLVSAPPHASIGDRLAHWTVLGATADECDQRADMIARHLTAVISGPVHTTSCAR